MSGAESTGSRTGRRRAVHAYKRGAILDAAERIFAARGLDGASIRDIADAAGYAPGALYVYFDGKEAIYAAILDRSLQALGAVVRDASEGPATSRDRVRRVLMAFFDYYAANPMMLDLSFYLTQGIRPRGLSRELDRRLNGRLIGVLSDIAAAIAAAAGRALDDGEANRETVAATTHLCGLLLMQGTGRLKVLGFDARTLAAAYLDQLEARIGAAA